MSQLAPAIVLLTTSRTPLLVVTIFPILAVGFPAYASASSGLESLFNTPACITGIRADEAVRPCIDKFPQARARYEKGTREWSTRNADALQSFSAYCQQGLAKLYRDLAMGPDEVNKLREAADKLNALMRKSVEETPYGFAAQCGDLEQRLETQTITSADVEKMAKIPLTLDFMQIVDPEFLRKIPPGVNASFQRDRGLHFAQSYTHLVELKTGITQLDRNCVGASLDGCLRAHKDVFGARSEPDRRERLPSGEEKLTFLGEKKLYRGTFSDNRPIGVEERVFILRNGRIADAWQSVQIIVGRWDLAHPPNYSCEHYGRQPGSSICIARSVD